MCLHSIYEEHADSMFTLALRLTGSAADAHDVVQDVFVALPRALPGFRGEGSFAGWLHKVTARRALMVLRKGRLRREVRLSPLDVSVRDLGADVIDRLWLDEAIRGLRGDLRAVLVLRMEGYSHAEVAEFLGISKQTSMGRLCRAKAQLREAMLR